ncbi:MAG: excinuclease ABC subunit UvrC [Firmicutes bacterium]|nr:excinuclease ABC subunit UvrC [Bacillota bacterium]
MGKAVNLRHRVRSYFQGGARHPARIAAMVGRAADVEWLATDSEVEALVLECNLIKGHRPPYNICLRDDKTYPYLKVTVQEDFPRVAITRRVVRDGARYYGPYTDVGAVRETLQLLRKLFPFRTCKEKVPGSRVRPCLNYHIKRCPGPCAGLVDREAYRAAVEEVCLFLEGRRDELLRALEGKMRRAAARLDFERAALYRDQLRAVRRVLEQQRVDLPRLGDLDAVAVALAEDRACAAVLVVRGGRVIAGGHHVLERTAEAPASEVLAAFLKQYYSMVDFVPKTVLLPEAPGEEAGVIAAWLARRRGGPVELVVPRRGARRRVVDLAAENARLMLQAHLADEDARRTRAEAALAELAGTLGLARVPHRLECYDVSGLHGEHVVASMVVMEGGNLRPSEYRRFNVRASGPDDCAAMAEVLRRRFERGLQERELLATGRLSGKEARFHRLPDLVLVDGGRGQLAAARQALEEVGLGHIPACGLAKEEERLYLPGRPAPLELPMDSPALLLLRRLRDEAHRFAVSQHRRRREKAGLASLLGEVEGVGPRRRRALLRAFGSLEAMRAASVEELAAVPGMTRRAAEVLHTFLRGGTPGGGGPCGGDRPGGDQDPHGPGGRRGTGRGGG